MILLAEVVERLIGLRDSVLIADTDPKTVFSDRKLMSSTHLYPPQITELSHRLKDKNFINTYALSIDEMQKVTDQQLQVKRSK
jgi:hypothetical protein